MGNNILNRYLLESGFSKAEGSSLEKRIFDDVYLKIVPVGNWDSFEEVSFYLNSPTFSRIMSKLFDAKTSLAWSYLPRKLRKDKDGCLAMSSVAVEVNSSSVTETVMSAGGESFSIQEFLMRLEEIKDASELYVALLDGFLGRILILIEGVWVYLYLANLNCFSPEKTLGDTANVDSLIVARKRWRMKKGLDEAIISLFFSVARESTN